MAVNIRCRYEDCRHVFPFDPNGKGVLKRLMEETNPTAPQTYIFRCPKCGRENQHTTR